MLSLKEIKEKEEKYLLSTYARLNLAFEYGKSATLYDMEGRDYIDFGSGIGVNSIGYGNSYFAETLKEQIQKLIHTSNLYHISNQALLAQKLVELSGYDMQVFFSNSGTESNETAIKLARKYGEIKFPSKRYKIITLKSSFHGRTLATLKATGQESFHRFFSPFPEGFEVAENLQEVYTKIDSTTCAVMLELIQGEGGIYAFPKEEIQALEQFLKKQQILLIIDEVQSGIYRTGEFLASQVYGISPDIITLAKGLGGGVPIGAVMTKHKDIFEASDHGSTFGGNFLSTKAGLEVINLLEINYKNHTLQEIISYFHQEIEQCLKEFPNLLENKVGLGLMLGIQTKDLQTQQIIINQAIKHRVILLRSGKNVLRLLPPLLITKEEIKEGFMRLRLALKEIVS